MLNSQGLPVQLQSYREGEPQSTANLVDGLCGSFYNARAILGHGWKEGKPFYRAVADFDVWAENFIPFGSIVQYWHDVQGRSIPEDFAEPVRRDNFEDEEES